MSSVLLGQPCTLRLELPDGEPQPAGDFWRCASGGSGTRAVVGAKHASAVLALHLAADRDLRGEAVPEGARVSVYGNTRGGTYLHAFDGGALRWGSRAPSRIPRKSAPAGTVAQLRLHRLPGEREDDVDVDVLQIGDRVTLLGPEGTAVCALARKGALALQLCARSVLAPSVFVVESPSMQHALSLAQASDAGAVFSDTDDDDEPLPEPEPAEVDPVFEGLRRMPTAVMLHILRLAPSPDGNAPARRQQQQRQRRRAPTPWVLACRLVCKSWRVALSQHITHVRVSMFAAMPRREQRVAFMDFVSLCRGLRTLSMPPMHNMEDGEAARLRELRRLRFVSFAGFRRVTDAGVAAALRDARQLEHLNVSGTAVTDDTLAFVAERFPYLKVLNVFACTRITATGLLALSACKELSHVNLRRTGIRDEDDGGALQQLQEALEECQLLVGS